jgi:hypothetical protein
VLLVRTLFSIHRLLHVHVFNSDGILVKCMQDTVPKGRFFVHPADDYGIAAQNGLYLSHEL